MFDESDEDFIYLSVDDAATFAARELGLDEEQVRDLVLTLDKNADGKISGAELSEFGVKLKQVKEHLLPLFRSIDSKGTGFVEPKQAVDIMSRECEGFPLASLTAMISRFDKDGNLKVDFMEFIDFYAWVKAKKEKLEKKFKELDVDGSGDLDADELVDTLKKECAIDESKARSIVNDFDLNKDGRIDKKEFNNMWGKLFG